LHEHATLLFASYTQFVSSELLIDFEDDQSAPSNLSQHPFLLYIPKTETLFPSLQLVRWPTRNEIIPLSKAKMDVQVQVFGSHMRHALDATETNLANGSIQPVSHEDHSRKKKRQAPCKQEQSGKRQ
jgi:hypothetical protein